MSGLQLVNKVDAGWPILTGGFPIDSATPSGQQPDGMAGKTLTFSDEFTGTNLDTSKWITTYPDWARFNAQSPGGNHTNTDTSTYYDTSKVTVGSGFCTLTEDKQVTVAGLAYTGGVLCSQPFWDQQFGIFEARLRISGSPTGFWPAWWMHTAVTNQWPPEIDIFEHYGGEAKFLNNVYLAGGITYFGEHSTTGIDLTAWHSYACEWRAGLVTYYLDGDPINTTTRIPDTSMFLIFDVAARAQLSPSFSTASMDIDYVRAWA